MSLTRTLAEEREGFGRFAEVLELTLLIAQKDSRRHPRGRRWLRRYLEEDAEATIEEPVLARSCLAALPGELLAGSADAAGDGRGSH